MIATKVLLSPLQGSFISQSPTPGCASLARGYFLCALSGRGAFSRNPQRQRKSLSTDRCCARADAASIQKLAKTAPPATCIGLSQHKPEYKTVAQFLALHPVCGLK